MSESMRGLISMVEQLHFVPNKGERICLNFCFVQGPFNPCSREWKRIFLLLEWQNLINEFYSREIITIRELLTGEEEEKLKTINPLLSPPKNINILFRFERKPKSGREITIVGPIAFDLATNRRVEHRPGISGILPIKIDGREGKRSGIGRSAPRPSPCKRYS